MQGKSQKSVDGAQAGDIVAVAKLKETLSGDTICDEKSQILLPKPVLPHAVISFAIEPKAKGDEEKIVENKYNRLLLYRSDLMHSSQSAFGNSIEDGRLTLTFTYNILAFDIKYNNEKFKKNERRYI